MTSEEFDIRVVGLSGRIFRFASRLTGDSDQAQDVLQDVLEKMWRKRLSLAACENVEAFVMQATRNRCYDVLRHRKVSRERSQPIAEDTVPAADGQHTAPMERSEIRRLIAAAIAALPEKQRMAIHLRDVEGCEFEEIAQVMECDVPSIRVYLSRARKTISRQLKTYRQS